MLTQALIHTAVRKELSQSLSGFIHTLQPSPGFVERLEIFRSETLARLDPVDKKNQAAANAAMDELLETTVGLENFVVPDIPISTTRAGLYIYLNASVSALRSLPTPRMSVDTHSARGTATD